jgi:hypothetical protein
MKRLSLRRRILGLGALTALAVGVLVPVTALAAPAQTRAGCAGNVQCIIQFGDARIAERQAALTKAAGTISGELSKGHITQDQANALLAYTGEGQTDMTQIKAKLDADTDATTARADVKAIFENYRIFAVLLPKAHFGLWADIATNVKDKLRDLQPKIQDAISKAPASEQQQLNSLFSDFQAQLSEAESQLDAAQGQYATLTIQTYNTDPTTYKTAFEDCRNDLKAAHTAIKQSASDLHQIVQILKGNKTATPTATTGA